MQGFPYRITLHFICIQFSIADSVRAFKERNKLGRFKELDPEEERKKEEERQRKEQENKEKAEKMKVGDR